MTEHPVNASGAWWVGLEPGAWSIHTDDGRTITDADLDQDPKGREAAEKHLAYLDKSNLRYQLSQLKRGEWQRYELACREYFGLNELREQGTVIGTVVALPKADRWKSVNTLLFPDLTALDVHRGMRMSFWEGRIKELDYIPPHLRFGTSQLEDWVRANGVPPADNKLARLGIEKRVLNRAAFVCPLPDMRTQMVDAQELATGVEVLVWAVGGVEFDDRAKVAMRRLWSDLGWVPESYLWLPVQSTRENEPKPVPHIPPSPPEPKPVSTFPTSHVPRLATQTGRRYWVRENNVRYRLGPGLNHPVEGQLMRGSTLTSEGAVVPADGWNWVSFTHDGKAVYIAREFLAESFVRTDPLGKVPVAPELVEAVHGTKLEGHERTLMAIAITETGARTSVDNGGELVFRFEPAQWDKLFRVEHGDPPEHWTVEKCYVTSWGVGQLMGWTHDTFSMPNALDFRNWLAEDPKHEYQALVGFCLAKPGVVDAIVSRNWDRLWVLYNGGHPHWLPNFKASLNRVDTKQGQHHSQEYPMTIPEPPPAPKPPAAKRLGQGTMEVNEADGYVKAFAKIMTGRTGKMLIGLVAATLLGTGGDALHDSNPVHGERDQVHPVSFVIDLFGPLLLESLASVDADRDGVSDLTSMTSAQPSATTSEPMATDAVVAVVTEVVEPVLPVLDVPMTYIVSVPRANVRAGADTSAAVVGQLTVGEEVEVVRTFGDWHQIAEDMWLHNSVVEVAEAEG